MKADFENKTLSYDIPVIYKFKNLIFKLPKDNKELYEYAMYLHCITGGEFNDLIEKHNKEHLIFGVYLYKESYLAKKLKHKNNLGYVLMLSLKDENIAFDMAIDGKRSVNDIDYQCIIESIFDDDMKEKEKIFKEFAKEFKNLDGLINDAIILMQKRKCKTSVSYLQRKLQIGYNRAEKIKNQVCMFGLMDEKEKRMEKNYKKFFDDIKELIEKRKKRGFNNYNLITTMLNPNDEVRVHSRIIYSLLDIEGEHYQNTLFLEFFLDVIGIKEYNIKNSKIYREYKNIDLYLTDGEKHIIIENKINADDQDEQIKRYIDTIKSENPNLSCENLYVIYLSKDREKPSPKSLGEKYEIKDGYIQENDKKLAVFKSIHYDYHIKRWIELALKEVENITNLSYALKQYQEVVDMINNEYKDKVMDLEDVILKDYENYKIAEEIKKRFDDIKNQFQDKIISNFENCCKFKKSNDPSDNKYGDAYYYETDKFSFKIQFGDKFYYGFVKKDNKENNNIVEKILENENNLNWNYTFNDNYWLARKDVELRDLFDSKKVKEIADDIKNIIETVEKS